MTRGIIQARSKWESKEQILESSTFQIGRVSKPAHFAHASRVAHWLIRARSHLISSHLIPFSLVYFSLVSSRSSPSMRSTCSLAHVQLLSTFVMPTFFIFSFWFHLQAPNKKRHFGAFARFCCYITRPNMRRTFFPSLPAFEMLANYQRASGLPFSWLDREFFLSLFSLSFSLPLYSGYI